MAINNNVNLQQLSNQYQKNDILTKPQKYQVNPNAVDKTPDKDTVQLSSGLTTKEKVGIGAAIATGIALITFAVLGRNGHLGESVQKFLGGKAKKAAQEMGEHTHTPNTHVEPKPTVKPEPEQIVKPEPEQIVKPELEQTVKPEPEQIVKPEPEQTVKPEPEQTVKPEPEQTVKPEPEQTVKPEPEQTVKPEPEQTVKPEPEQTVKPEPEQTVKPEPEQTVKPEPEQTVKPEQKVETKAEQEAKAKAEQEAIKDIEIKETEFSEQLQNMSRSELAKIRHDLDRYSGDLYQLEKKSQKEGLTKLEQVKLDSLKRQRELIRNRENEIEKSLEKFKPTFADNTQVSMHHGISGQNCKVREVVEARTNGFKGLDEDEVKDILATEKYMEKVDKEFAKLPPLEKDCIVYRGRNEHPVIKRFNKDFEIMDKAKVGDVIVPDTGYSYTAFNRSMAENWGGEGARFYNEDGSLTRNIMYEIHLPKGAKVSRNGEHCGEVVMPRGAQYIIKDKKVDKEGCMEVVLEYILPRS